MFFISHFSRFLPWANCIRWVILFFFYWIFWKINNLQIDYINSIMIEFSEKRGSNNKNHNVFMKIQFFLNVRKSSWCKDIIPTRALFGPLKLWLFRKSNFSARTLFSNNNLEGKLPLSKTSRARIKVDDYYFPFSFKAAGWWQQQTYVVDSTPTRCWMNST